MTLAEIEKSASKDPMSLALLVMDLEDWLSKVVKYADTRSPDEYVDAVRDCLNHLFDLKSEYGVELWR